MREEIIKVYKYEELSDEAKEVAKKWWKKCLDEDFSVEASMITENFQEELRILSYPTDDIEWSLSCSQGDGVAFYGEIGTSDMEEIVKRAREKGALSNEEFTLFRKIIDHDYSIYGKITRNSYGHRYSHWNTMVFEIASDSIDTIIEELYEFDDEDFDTEPYNDKHELISNLLDKIEDFISDEIKDVSRTLEKQGYDEIDYHYSDETVEGNLIHNEYEFTEDGKRW